MYVIILPNDTSYKSIYVRIKKQSKYLIEIFISMMAFEKPLVVIDNGSYSIKAGFSCDNHPVSIFRTFVGRPSYLNGTFGRTSYEVYIGDEVFDNDHDLELSLPVENGKITHWDNMERIWHHIFYKELKVAPEDRSVVLACGPTASLEEKIRCCEMLFETLNIPALCIQSQNVLTMYGSGVTTGLCVDLGYSSTSVMPVFEGGSVSYAHVNTGFGGLQLLDYIKSCLEQRSLFLPQADIENILQESFITKNCAMGRNFQQKYVLSSGTEIDVTNEVFMAAEMLFQPDSVKGGPTEYISLQGALVTALLKCDDDLRSELCNSIIPCGGLAQIPGLNERLEVELEDKLNKPVSVLSSLEPYTLTWLGGAVLAGLDDMEQMFILKNQYEDYGEKIIQNKFI